MTWQGKYPTRARQQPEHPGANKYFICYDYDPFNGVTETMFLVMLIETEQRGDWTGGKVIRVNGREYVLGPRKPDNRNGLSVYELVLRRQTALSLDD